MEPDVPLSKQHSFCGEQQKKSVVFEPYCKSDVCLKSSNEFENHYTKTLALSSENRGCGEYYKRYEYDPTPVKDYSSEVTSTDTGKGGRVELTESHLANLEQNIFSNISLHLDTSASSSSLDTNTKFFKTTVEEIFDKFYANMCDIEQYKNRYIEIMDRNRNGSFEEMEYFIKDMIHHIMSSETSDFNECRLCQVADKATTVSNTDYSTSGSLLRVVESFENDNYLTDSNAEEKIEGRREYKRKVVNNDILNIYLMGKKSSVKGRMNNRKLLSEINIKDSRGQRESAKQTTASAEDIKKIAAKKLQLEKYEQQNEQHTFSQPPDREIPVKMSFAKKNIHLNQDFANESSHSSPKEKSLLSRFCNYLCKKLRKTL